MGAAAISVNSGTAGESDITVDIGDTITLDDVGGGTPGSRLWTMQRWPAPLASPPAFSPDAISENVTFTATESGGHIIHLQRTDSGVTTAAQVLVGVRNSLGLIIPCAGMSGQLIRVAGNVIASQEEGWWGHTRSASNVFLDAIFRQLLGSVTSEPTIDIVRGLQVNNQTSFSEVGVARFDPATIDTALLTQFRLRAFIQTSDAGDGAELLLRNLTAPADTVTLGPFANTTTVFVESALIALPAVVTDFAARIRLDTTGDPNIVSLKGAWLALFP